MLPSPGPAEALQQPQGNGGAGLGVGEGVVVVGEVETAGGGDGVELVVWQAPSKVPTGSCKRIKERIVRVIHPVYLKYGFQTALVKGAVVRHQR